MRIGNLKIKDFCVIGNAELSMEDKGLVLVSGENKDSDAADSNGSGKTTLFKALTWGFFGHAIDGDKAASVIREGADSTEVTIDLIEDEDKTWVIARERGKSEKLTIHGPEGLVVDSKDGLQALIEKLLGLDFRAFCSTVLYGQQDSARFSNKNTTDAQRKDILHRILKTSFLKQCEKFVRAAAKDIEDSIAPIRLKAESTRAALDEYDLEEITEKEAKWEGERRERLESIRGKVKAKDRDVVPLRRSLERIPKEIWRHQKRLVALGDFQSERKAIARVRDKAQERINKAREAIAKFVAQETQALEQLEMLDGDECPICTSPLTDETPAKHIGIILGDLEDIRERLTGLRALLEKCGKQRAKANGMIDACDVRSEEARHIKEDIAELESDKKVAEATLRGTDEAVAGLKEQAKTQRGASNPHAESLVAAKARTDKLNKRLAEINKVLKLKDEELAHHQYWVKGFSGKGLPSFVLDSVMPMLTESTNHYLETLSDGDITMSFDTRTTLKSGDERDKINISWVIEGSEGTTPSQGQSRKMEVATDLALMDLAESREGGSLDLLLLDEVLDGLDAAGRARIVELLHELRAKRRSIFVISHDPMMAEVFENVITFVKQDQVSMLEAA